MQGRVGVVVIGRNDGMRLTGALQAALAQAARVVYVDSGSRDNSVDRARALGVPVIELDAAIPFTAARARNAGAAFWLKREPELEFLQFVDGDCELAPGFLASAVAALDGDSSVAVACGRRREQFPDASIYNRLSDIESDAPMGETSSCGGDALVRVHAFVAAGGFNPNWIAGEEPEFCLRLRRARWKILRVDAEMTRHDARLVHFSQWWRRSVRTGYAYAQGAWHYGQDAEHHWLRESLSIWFWGVALWSCALVFARLSRGSSLALLFGYPALVTRILARGRRHGLDRENATIYALFCVLAKFPQLQGQILFLWNRSVKRPARLIEYRA
jgi:glycosyltransferase involved in cell wall biosynthesis